MRSTKSPSWSERLLGLDPRPVPPHVFAASREALRYASFGTSERGLELRERQGLALDEQVWSDASPGALPRDQEAFAATVGELVARLGGGVRQASLVLPDDWLRLAFVELGDLPRQEAARQEVLRFKLKRLVPFRIDELRLTAWPVRPLPGQQEPLRALVGFANEAALGRFEEAFARHGIEIGQITNASLATSAALLSGAARAGGEGLTVLLAASDGYSLVSWWAGEPVLFRQKPLPATWDLATRATALERELRLSEAFLVEQVGRSGLGPVVVVAPRDDEAFWCAAVREALGSEPAPLRPGLLPFAGELGGREWGELAALAGAALTEVA